LEAPPLITMVSIDQELSAIFNVIKSSLAFNNSDLPIQVLCERENKARLAQELTNYISLLIMKREMANPSVLFATTDLQGKASEVTNQILNSVNGIQALIQVVFDGQDSFDINLEVIISRH